ncbi:hypothetical protein SRHO_G00076620 [Serrasalmus rhombeus]
MFCVHVSVSVSHLGVTDSVVLLCSCEKRRSKTADDVCPQQRPSKDKGFEIAAEETQSSRISSHRVCSLVVKASGG